MKKILIASYNKMVDKCVLFILILIIISNFSNAQNLLNGPEGIVFDAPNNRYLVANATSGTIVQIDSSGIHSIFKSGLSVPLGMHIVGNTLYVSTNSPPVLKGFDLTTSDSVMIVHIPTALGLSGISSDTSGNLYIADQGGKIFRVQISNHNLSTIVSYGLPQGPQGLFFEQKKNRLLIVCFQMNSPIMSVDLVGLTVSIVVNTSIGQFTAITKVDDYNFYICSWKTGSVHKYDSAFTNPPVVFSSGHSQPTGLFYNSGERILAISNYGSSTVNFIPVPPVSVRNNGQVLPHRHDLKQNYPNPFNPVTHIRFDIPKNNTHVTLSIYNLQGKKIATLVNDNLNAGSYEVDWVTHHSWSSSSLSSGVYFYRLVTEDFIDVKKMIHIK